MQYTVKTTTVHASRTCEIVDEQTVSTDDIFAFIDSLKAAALQLNNGKVHELTVSFDETCDLVPEARKHAQKGEFTISMC